MGMRINTPLPFETYRDIRASVRQLYIQLPSWIAALSGGDVEYPVLDGMFQHLKNAETQWAAQLAVADVPALKLFAKDQHSDPAFDAAVEYAVLRDATQAAYAWLKANVTSNTGIDQPPAVLTSAQSAPFVVLLQVVQAACE